jgi:hypothetical protein
MVFDAPGYGSVDSIWETVPESWLFLPPPFGRPGGRSLASDGWRGYEIRALCFALATGTA